MIVRALRAVGTGLGCLLLLFGAAFAHAQVEGVQIKPAVIEDRADPGETYQFSVTVTNVSDDEKTFFLVAEDITGIGDDGLPIFAQEGEDTPYELSSWIALPDQSITLAANQSRTVPFSIRVPQDASPGAHFGGVFFDSRPPRLRTTGAAIGMRVGSIINLRIAGEATEEARLREFSTDKIVYGHVPVNFQLTVENLGNVLLRPTGLIEITDMFGRQVGNIRVNETGASVFPLSEKQYVVEWNDDRFLFGRYQAIGSLVYGEDSRKTITRATSFWILPAKPLLIGLGSLLVFLLATYGFVRAYIRRKLREMGIAKGSEAMYARRYKPLSRMTAAAFIAIIFCVVFLFVLFFLFA